MQNPTAARPKHGGNLAWAAELAGCSPSSILDFSASINPLGPPDSALAAIQSHLPLLCHYPDPEYPDLRQAIAQHHQLPPEWILPGNGSAELLTWACRELADQSSVYLPVPAFGDYRRALKTFSATVISIQDWFDPAVPCTPVRTLAVPLSACGGILINNPHNPTGQLFSQKSLLPLLGQFDLVVVDEAFMDFLPPDQEESLIAQVQNFPNLVILRSLTKFYSLPGLRLGYAIAHPDRLRRWQQWRDPWSVNTLAAAAAVAALSDQEFQSYTWNWLRQARSHLFEGLSHLPGLHPLPGAANFLLVQSDSSVVDLQKKLLLHDQILIRDCLSFPELGDRYFRVAVRTGAQNQQLLAGLTAVLGGWHGR